MANNISIQIEEESVPDIVEQLLNFDWYGALDELKESGVNVDAWIAEYEGSFIYEG